jgi:hypothetical protein
MGLVSCRRSYVIFEDSSEDSWILGRSAIIQGGHRRFDVDNEYLEESVLENLNSQWIINSSPQDIASPNPTDIATALDGLSHFITPDIARDLSLDVIAMLNHSRPKIRKRAVLIMYKVFEKYPDVIPRSMTRLREKLEDPDPGRSLSEPMERDKSGEGIFTSFSDF